MVPHWAETAGYWSPGRECSYDEGSSPCHLAYTLARI
jgi:hypothetical protein